MFSESPVIDRMTSNYDMSSIKAFLLRIKGQVIYLHAGETFIRDFNQEAKDIAEINAGEFKVIHIYLNDHVIQAAQYH